MNASRGSVRTGLYLSESIITLVEGMWPIASGAALTTLCGEWVEGKGDLLEYQ